MPRKPDQHTILARVHTNDYKMLRKLFIDDGLTFQAFVEACVQAYISGNKEFIKVVKVYKEFNEVPRSIREANTLSARERQEILKEIEQAEKLTEGDKES